MTARQEPGWADGAWDEEDEAAARIDYQDENRAEVTTPWSQPEMAATPRSLGPMVEQPEPTTKGSAYVVSMEHLMSLGFTYVEIHFPDDSMTEDGGGTPDSVIFHKA